MQDNFGATEGFVRLWVYKGPPSNAESWAREWGIADPVLYDEDGSVTTAYFIGSGAEGFAMNPRHYVIGRDGRLAYVSAQVAPGNLTEAIEAALAP